MNMRLDAEQIFGGWGKQATARSLMVEVPVISAEETNAKVLEVFGKYRELISLPVIDNGHPMGLISRNIFMSQMSMPYHRELYEKKSCIAFMDKHPLIVEVDTPIEKIGALAVESGDKTLRDGFLIVEQGALLGFGSGLDLMRMLVALQENKNRQVMQSIDYASVIQRAMLNVSRTAMLETLKDACLIWQPRDVVGGDFYHFQAFEDGWFAAVADCTGHGVPGAFLTLIASSALKQALDLHGPRHPSRLMREVNVSMKDILGQHAEMQSQSGSNDGMDACFFWFDAKLQQLIWASAKMTLFIVSPDSDELLAMNGDRMGLGYVETSADEEWKQQHLRLNDDAVVMVATDGVIDQIGGKKNIAFGKKRLCKLLKENQHLPMPVCGQKIMEAHHAYQGLQRRRDDLTLFGFRVNGFDEEK